MKKLVTLLMFIVTVTIAAQAPQGFNYQATVRNNAGVLIINKSVSFKFNIIPTSASGTAVYSESQTVTTDDLGQVSLVIGKGTATTGTFATIDWGTGTYYLGIELNTGNGFVGMGTTQLLSVPYALYAKNAGSSEIPNLASVLAKNNSANNAKITNLADPTDAQDAVTKNFLKSELANLQTQISNLQKSLKSPENLVVTIANDSVVSKKVTVTATADYAWIYKVYFGEATNEVPVQVNNGESVSHVYTTAGTYKIKIVSINSAIIPTLYEENFVVTAIMAPTASAPTPSSRAAGNVVGIYGAKYTNVSNSNFFPDWGQAGQGSSWAEFDLNGDKMLKYSNLSYQGIEIGSEVNATSMQFLHVDIWTATSMSIDIYPLPNGVVPANEKFVTKSLVANQWNSFDIPLSDFTSQGLPISNLKQFKLVGTPWAAGTVFIDNIYFYKNPVSPAGIVGNWKVASEPGSLGVGPAPGSKIWWINNASDITTRSCFYDDTYVFESNGSFRNVLGNSTWLESWQGTADACGTPVAPHNGTSSATYLYDSVAGTITITGIGAYLGLARAINTGELAVNSIVPNTRVYTVTLSNGNNTMELTIETGRGVFWYFKLVRD